MKKILVFSTYFHPYLSGMTTYLFNILIPLSKKYKITVLTFRYDKKLSYDEYFHNIHIIRMPYSLRLSKGFISLQSLMYFVREIRNTDFVLLNIPNFEALPLTAFAFFSRKKVFSIFLCGVVLKKSPYSLIISLFLNFSIFIQLLISDKIIGFPDYLDNDLFGKLFRYKIETTLPPIRKPSIDKRIVAQLRKKKGNDIWIGYVGRVSEEKGLNYLIGAIELLKKSKAKVQLIMAGPYGKGVVGEERYFRSIKRTIIKNRIPHIFLGRISNNYLGAFYRTVDVIVLPSINKTEAFGMVQAEAMTLGTPVVASNLPGVRLPILLTRMGISVEPKNSQKISSAIIEILKHKDHFANKELVVKAKQIFAIKKIEYFYNNLFS